MTRDEQIAEAIERCARVAESYNRWDYVQRGADGEFNEPGSPFDRGQQTAAQSIAAMIRAIHAKADK